MADRQRLARRCRAAPPGGRPARAAGPRAPGRRRRRRRGRRRGRRRRVGLRRRSRRRARAAATSSRGAARGAARRVDLAGVVQLDDLDRLEEAGRLPGEPHHQHRADREVGRDEHADARRRRRASPAPSPAARRRSRWCRRRRGRRARRRTRRLPITASGWVKSTATCAPASTSVSSGSPTSMRADQLEVVGAPRPPDSLAAHPARGAEHGHTRVVMSAQLSDGAVKSRSSSNGPTTASVGVRGQHVGGDRADVVERDARRSARARRRPRAARRRRARPCRCGSSASRCPRARGPASRAAGPCRVRAPRR